MNKEVRQRWTKIGIGLGVLVIVVTIAISVAAIYYKDDLMSLAHVARYSLLGMFIIAFIAGSIISVTVIVPYWILIFTLASVLAAHWGLLAPVWVGIISALGASLGQLLTFMIGYGGSNIYQRFTANNGIPNSTWHKFYTRAMDWSRRHGSWAIFLMTAVLNPFHSPMTIAMAALRFPPPKFFLLSLMGNTVKSLFIAFCGYFGLSSLFRFLGM